MFNKEILSSYTVCSICPDMLDPGPLAFHAGTSALNCGIFSRRICNANKMRDKLMCGLWMKPCQSCLLCVFCRWIGIKPRVFRVVVLIRVARLSHAPALAPSGFTKADSRGLTHCNSICTDIEGYCSTQICVSGGNTPFPCLQGQGLGYGGLDPRLGFGGNNAHSLATLQAQQQQQQALAQLLRQNQHSAGILYHDTLSGNDLLIGQSFCSHQ